METKTPQHPLAAPPRAPRTAGTLKPQVKAVPCWFMSNPFSAELVYSQLDKADFEYVVGMDIGHGESLVALFCKSTGKVELLNLNADYDRKIPSYIRFQGETAVIGKKAQLQPGFIQHFKVPPRHWDQKRDGYTYRMLMGHFIRTLWEQALQRSDALRNAPRDKVMIVVGCPASPVWTDAKALSQYRDLVRDATHYPHVSILPESTAAIMSIIHNDDGQNDNNQSAGKPLRLDRGIAVLDAGSSTLDFTYVILGKKLVTRSLTLGGSDLDRLMLELILEQNNLTEDQIPAEQIPDILVELRQAKERFYPDRIGQSKKHIYIWGRNPDGTGSSNIDSGLALVYQINESFMTSVLTRKTLEPEGIVGGAKMSWLEMARQFIENNHSLIERDDSGKLLCDRLLVTGGTSFVSELVDAIKSIYGPGLAVQSRDPSSSVAKGLAHAKRLDIQGRELVQKYRQEIQDISDKAYQELLEDLCSYLAGISCDLTQEVCASLSQTPGWKKIDFLMDQVTRKAAADPRLKGPDFDAAVQKLFQKHFLRAYDTLREKANEVSAQIYGANLEGSYPHIPPLEQKELRYIASKLNLKGFVSNALLNRTVSDSFFSMLQGFALIAVYGLAGTGNLPAAAVALVVYLLMGIGSIQTIVRKLFSFIPFGNGKLADYANKLAVDDFRKETIYKLSQSTAKEIRKQAAQKEKLEKKEGRRLKDPRPLYKEFTTCLSEQAEAILGKLLFLVYDEKPDTGESDVAQ